MWRLRKENWLLPSKKKVKTKIIYLDNAGNDKTTSLIAFIFGMLVHVGKKIVCLQCGFKSWRESRDIDLWLWCHITKTFARVKNSISSRVLFFAIHFALSWPCDSLPGGLINYLVVNSDVGWLVDWHVRSITKLVWHLSDPSYNHPWIWYQLSDWAADQVFEYQVFGI